MSFADQSFLSRFCRTHISFTRVLRSHNAGTAARHKSGAEVWETRRIPGPGRRAGPDGRNFPSTACVTTPADAFIHVPEGTGIVEMEDDKAVCTKDMPVESPARIPHRFMYIRTDATRIGNVTGSWTRKASCRLFPVSMHAGAKQA